jgi:hypothetical protein
MVYKKLTEQLYFYLIQHNFLHLPGLGDCILNRIPASIDGESHALIAPHYAIQFTPSDHGTARELFSFLAERIQISAVDAIKLVTEYAMELKESLQHEGEAELEYIGKLYYNQDGLLCLSAQPMNVDFLYQTVPKSINIETIKTVISLDETENDTTSNELIENELDQNVEIEEDDEADRIDKRWIKHAVFLISIALLLFSISKFAFKTSSLSGSQTLIHVKTPFLQHD